MNLENLQRDQLVFSGFFYVILGVHKGPADHHQEKNVKVNKQRPSLNLPEYYDTHNTYNVRTPLQYISRVKPMLSVFKADFFYRNLKISLQNFT